MDTLDLSTLTQVVIASRDTKNPGRAAQAKSGLQQWWFQYEKGLIYPTPECLSLLKANVA